MQHGNRQYFDSNKGLDLKSSDVVRSPRFASSMMNAQYKKSGAVEKRKGFQYHSPPSGGYGLFTYKRIDENDQLDEIVLDIGQNLSRLRFTNIAVSYAGSEAAAYLSFFFDPLTDQYRCQIVAGLTQVLDFPCGKGFEENSPVEVADLATAINALSGFTAVVTGTSSTPAAYIRVVRDLDVKANTWNGKAGYWEQVNQAVANPFDGTHSRRGNLDFENASAVVIANVLYISNGYEFLYKYDGQNLYRAGLPRPSSLTSSLAAGGVTGTNYVHRAQYVQVDAVGNVIEGNIFPVATPLNPVAQGMSVVVANLTTSGFNLNAAIVAGAQVSVNTITVDDGSGGNHTMKIGDTAYFFDAVSGGYVERLVTNTAINTITVAGAAVTVADNAVISNNLRIMIQRNYTSGVTPTVFYEVVQLPNNPFTATQTFTDNLADSALGNLVNPPLTDRGLPPKGKYLASYQQLLFMTGNIEDPTKVYWSDIDGPEYFPAGTNEDRVETEKGEAPVAIAGAGNVLAVWTASSTVIGSGTFGDLNYRFDEKAKGIGCSAHSSIAQVEGFVVWWSNRGPYAMAGGEMPAPLGTNGEGEGRLSPVMDQQGLEYNPAFENQFFRTKRIQAFNWTKENLVLFYLPAETVLSGERIPNSNSVVYAYDYSRDAWLQWNNLSMAGGICAYQDEVYFKTRRFSSLLVDFASELARFHNLNDAWDYEDNDEPIDWEYGPQWEALGQPGVLKKFLELQVYSLEDTSNNNLAITVKQEINYQRDALVAEFNLALAGAGYGNAQYGTDPYGDPLVPKLKHELAGRRCFATRTVFTNEDHQKNCILTGWELLFATPYRVEFKK